jgi:RNA polymerase sigma-70 factor (ECF subfamily)
VSKEEAELIRRAKKGDSSAFSQIYRECQPAVYRYVVLRVGNTAAAEDLTGEVFVRLVDKIDHFQYRGRPLLAWLYTIARNLVADYHRRRGRYATIALDELPLPSQTCPEDTLERHLDEFGLATAIPRLTDGQQQVIILKFAQGMDNASVAKIMGRSVGAVKELQRRALAKLRTLLQESEEDG